MKLTLIDSPQLVTTLRATPRPEWIAIRVFSGTARFAENQETLLAGDGLPITNADNIVRLPWMNRQLWAKGNPTAVLEVILP